MDQLKNNGWTVRHAGEPGGDNVAQPHHAHVTWTGPDAAGRNDAWRLHVLECLVADMSGPVVFLDPAGRVELCNRSGAELLVGGGSSSPPAVREFLRDARDATDPLPNRTLLVDMPSAPGRKPRRLRVVARGVLDERAGHVGYLMVGQDVTEQSRLEESVESQSREIRTMSEKLRRHEQETAQQEKMAAIGTMAAGVAHEVGNPLTCLSAIVQLLRRRNHCQEDREQLAIIEEQIARIVKILRGLLDFARPDGGQRRLVDLDEVVEQTVQIARYSHRSRHAKIDSRRSTGLAMVHTVPEQVQQVLVNLLLNAFDAVADVSSDRAVIVVERWVQDGWVAVRISDQGSGMTDEQLGRAFEPFYTTKPSGTGTGMGLAVSRGIVEALGGRMEISSSPGKATAATVWFPAAESASVAVAAGQGALAAREQEV